MNCLPDATSHEIQYVILKNNKDFSTKRALKDNLFFLTQKFQNVENLKQV